MSAINYTYGILTGGVVPATSPWYRNCKNIQYTCQKQRELVNMLWGSGRSIEAIGCSTDAIIKLIQCDENFGRYIQEYDRLNTYDTSLIYTVGDIPGDTLSFRDLITWADRMPYSSPAYPIIPAQAAVVRITNALLSTLTLKG